MTNREALEKLKELANDLENVDYEDIKTIIKSSIKQIPIPLAKLKPGTLIDRARPNSNENLFTKVKELNYITDQNTIDTRLTEFGRANKPHQPMFYGAVESSLIGTQRITALCEISEILQDPTAVCLDGKLYTVSRWQNQKELLLVEMVFAEAAIKINPDTKSAFEKQIAFADQLKVNDIEFFKDLLVFISEQFAREIQTHHEYKISVAYTELVLTHPDVQGVAYPSVATKYHGQNVVFPPAVIDDAITIQVLATQRVHRNGNPVCINNHKNCYDPQKNPDNLTWVDVDPNYVYSLDEIYEILGVIR